MAMMRRVDHETGFSEAPQLPELNKEDERKYVKAKEFAFLKMRSKLVEHQIHFYDLALQYLAQVEEGVERSGRTEINRESSILFSFAGTSAWKGIRWTKRKTTEGMNLPPSLGSE